MSWRRARSRTAKSARFETGTRTTEVLQQISGPPLPGRVSRPSGNLPRLRPVPRALLSRGLRNRHLPRLVKGRQGANHFVDGMWRAIADGEQPTVKSEAT